jgi:ABC-type multidrug transport system fused ATPase/permease subunit
MKNIKSLLKDKFKTIFWFRHYTGNVMFVSILLSFAVGILDGFGLTMFLPLIKMSTDNKHNNEELEENIFTELLQKFNLELNLNVILLIMLLFFLLKGGSKYLSASLRVVLQQRLVRNIRIEIIKLINKRNIVDFSKDNIGKLQNCLTGEIDKISNAFQYYFKSIEDGILVFLYIVFAFFIDAQFAILVTIGGGLANFIYKYLFEKTKGASKQLTAQNSVFQGNIIQYLTGFKYLKATGGVDVFSNFAVRTIKNIEVERKKIGLLSAIMEASREPIMMIVIVIVILFQVNILRGSLAPILLSLIFFYRALAALTHMQSSWNKYLSYYGSIDVISDLQSKLKMELFKGSTSNTSIKNNISQIVSIKLVDVGFYYERENSVLNNIHFSIQRFDNIAIVGESGGGKSTLLNILLGLITPTKGEVLVNNVNIKIFDENQFKSRIGYVTQDPIIFEDTIYNNVSFWKPKTKTNIEQFNKVMEYVNLSNFVEQFVDKEDHTLEIGGANLSGGQKQRLAIARELFKDIDILVLDEATSALDANNESVVLDSLNSLRNKITMVTVAHRISSVKHCDTIYLIESGVIKAKGNFDELVSSSPEFNEMVSKQLL